jgi:hypothetical protein
MSLICQNKIINLKELEIFCLENNCDFLMINIYSPICLLDKNSRLIILELLNHQKNKKEVSNIKETNRLKIQKVENIENLEKLIFNLQIKENFAECVNKEKQDLEFLVHSVTNIQNNNLTDKCLCTNKPTLSLNVANTNKNHKSEIKNEIQKIKYVYEEEEKKYFLEIVKYQLSLYKSRCLFKKRKKFSFFP